MGIALLSTLGIVCVYVRCSVLFRDMICYPLQSSVYISMDFYELAQVVVAFLPCNTVHSDISQYRLNGNSSVFVAKR